MDFGEVVTTSSRAFWDDYEDAELFLPERDCVTLDFGTSNTAGVTPEHVATQLSTVDTLLCLEGRTIGDFTATAILQTGSRQLFQVANRQCGVHLLADGCTAVLLSGEHDLMAFGAIANVLVPLLGRIKRVCALNVESAVTYKMGKTESDDRREPCFLRALASEPDELLVSGVTALKEPNFVTGVAAGIVSWRKFRSLPWSSYVAYVNEPKINSLTAAPMLALIRRLGIPCAATYSERCVNNESNLYT